ncbi:hypothetical protein A3A66_03305 [Microgenomates group bacterium RIFCSPLOWO2_01_FULL_46_13]|nr:MAG: hypothetical protein A2783_04480 [Microgenomates group bacterium RIFCSPHIGHO2_01_FULL_45_11]OGV95020.1 MAG: hypothetical protein A3A66_03305 [Microgenomates group bacterium RIFCSPLOWO2_01_FULL_46_13]
MNHELRVKSKKTNSLFGQVYKLVQQIPSGKVTTYGEIALALGTRDARKVGWALHQNPDGNTTPCHRVVNRAGKLAPNFAFDGSQEQRRRLEAEGVTFIDDRHVDLKKHLHRFIK